MTEYDLLNKSELKFQNISLENADLNDVAASVAGILNLSVDEVLVTDYQNHVMTLDILRKTVDPHQILSKKNELLQGLSRVPGVTITDKTTVFSEGMLGWIALDDPEAGAALTQAENMAEQIRQRLAKRAIVFSTGGELLGGQVKDTNTVTIRERLEAEGYSVSSGPTLKDDRELIAGTLRKAFHDNGFNLMITTGGVGAEHKDHTVEAVLALDSEAATPYICRFEKGTGRHHKDGVRIAVGELGDGRIISLPGPNDEVRASMDVLVDGLKNHLNKQDLAEAIAGNLRGKLREKMKAF